MRLPLSLSAVILRIIPLLVTVGFSAQATDKPAIVSAGAGISDIIESLGAAELLIGVDSTTQLKNERDLPVIGYHRQLSAEGILSLKPSHLIGSDAMGSKDTLNILKRSGVEVISFESGGGVAGLKKRIRQLGEITGTKFQAEKISEDVDKQLAGLKRGALNQRGLFLLVHAGRSPSVGGNDTTADQIIALMGAENAANDINGYKPISGEAIAALQPDFILVSQRGKPAEKKQTQLLRLLPTLSLTPAVKNNAVYNLNSRALLGGLSLLSLAEASRLQNSIGTGPGTAH
ncbi:ABC transporter substrate-binding protein [Parasalinivibrio latis]|uniref:heme/hemin ABC transporter substrate-binding protein n=1 Tax=Parasalinivibrio latis TaxID=2952610 RepID=UPI0030E32F6D